MRNQYRLDIKEAGARSRPRQQICDAEQALDVRDLVTRATVQVRVQNLSPYRHTLLMDGKEFQILNVVRQY